MTASAVVIERSGPAVSAALAEVDSIEAAKFESEFKAALTQAAETKDLRQAERVLDRWWGVATIRTNPLTPDEQELVRQVLQTDVTQ